MRCTYKEDIRETCADTMRQPAGNRTHVWLCRPRRVAALELQRDAGKVFTKADNVEPRHGARQIRCRPRLCGIRRFLYDP